MRFLVIQAYWVETERADSLELETGPMEGRRAMVSITEREALSRGVSALRRDLGVFGLERVAEWARDYPARGGGS